MVDNLEYSSRSHALSCVSYVLCVCVCVYDYDVVVMVGSCSNRADKFTGGAIFITREDCAKVSRKKKKSMKLKSSECDHSV